MRSVHSRIATRRIVVTALCILVVGGVIASLWNADELRVGETAPNSPNARADALQDPLAPTSAGVRRDTLDTPVVPVATTSAPLAFIGRVEDFDGDALADARVVIVNLDEGTKVPGAEARTHTNGAFELPVETARVAMLEFTAKDYVGEVRVGVAPNEAIVVRLQRGVALAGRVIDARTRDPIAQAQVTLAEPGGFRTATAFADDLGRFAIVVRRVPALLRANAKDYGEGRAFVPEATDAVEVGLSAGAVTSTAWYRVVDRDSKAPVETAVIRPGPSERAQSGLYRAGAWFGFEQERSAWVKAPGYLDYLVVTKTVGGEDETHPLDVVLRPASSIRGTLVDAAGRALADATITVMRGPSEKDWIDADERFIRTRAKTDAQGAFAIADVPMHLPLRLIAERDGALVFERVPIEVETRDPLMLGELRAEAGIALEVVVTRADDRAPVANALVRAIEADRVRVTHSDTRGIAAFPAFGRVRVVFASAPGLAPAWKEIDTGLSSQRIECALRPAGHLSGIVTDLAGVPLEGARVDATLRDDDPVVAKTRREMGGASTDPLRFAAITDAAGRFVLSNLVPGKYGVGASQSDATVYALGAPEIAPLEVETDRDDIELKLPLASTLVMHVTTAARGLAIDQVVYDATVFVAGVERGGRGGSMQRTNGYASIEVTAGVEFSLAVSAGGYAPHVIQHLVLAPREVKLLEVKLDAESTFSGVARFPDGTAAAGAQITLTTKMPGLQPVECTCDATGAFRATRLPAGEFALSVRIPVDLAANMPDWLLLAQIEPATVTTAAGEAHTQIVVVRASKSGPFDVSFAVEGMPADAEVVSVTIEFLAGDERLLYLDRLPRPETPLRIAGLPLGPCVVRGRYILRAKADGKMSVGAAAFEPATIDVTKGMGNVSLVVRPEAK